MFVEDNMQTVSSPGHGGNKGRHDELRQSSNAPKAQAAQGGSVCDMRRFSGEYHKTQKQGQFTN